MTKITDFLDSKVESNKESGKTDKYAPFWLKDMIVIGQGAPNKIKKIDGRQGRCVALWSEKTGYCRIYPVPYGYLHDWDIIDVQVRKPHNDQRENSYAVYNYENEWNNLNARLHTHKRRNKLGKLVAKKLTRKDQIDLVRNLAKDTFSVVRDSKRSFGIIKPITLEFNLKQQNETTKKQQTLLCADPTDLDNIIMDQKDYKYRPYIEYTCDETHNKCTAKHPHHSNIVSWEDYSFMKPDSNNYNHCIKLKKNYHIEDKDYEVYLLIGNIRKWPKTYEIVKVIRFKKNAS
jgi:hypothetical protein